MTRWPFNSIPRADTYMPLAVLDGHEPPEETIGIMSPVAAGPNQAYRPLLPSLQLPFEFRPTGAKQRVSVSVRASVKYVAVAAAAVIVLLFFLLGPLSTSTRARWGGFGQSSFQDELAALALADSLAAQIDPSASQPGAFFRDSFPIRTALGFWRLAEEEAAAGNWDTCGDKLGRKLVEAYHTSQVEYCVPQGQGHFQLVPTPQLSPRPASHMTCTPVHHHSFSNWWPYPAAPCFSSNLRTVAEERREWRSAGCSITPAGEELREEMGREWFPGTSTSQIDINEEEAECLEHVEHTVMFIGRQDQWNPFHVAEDLITTLVTMFIAARTEPAFINSRLQLIFTDEFTMDANHFTPLYDRMGAWAPRRLSLDPWDTGVCLTNAIHSVGAGASLLSAIGIGNSNTCTSTITWAASHYYRHLFGLSPWRKPEVGQSGRRPTRPLNVLWLSRQKLDSWATKHNDQSNWRAVRHIKNEPELIARFKSGMRDMCNSTDASRIFGDSGCRFEDRDETPETWGATSSSDVEDGEPVPLRFAYFDPTVHALENQVHLVGHTSIMISSHGGAMGLSIFMPPGQGAMIELQVPAVMGNFPFQHMAAQTGHGYEIVQIERHVDVEQVWGRLEDWIIKVAAYER